MSRITPPIDIATAEGIPTGREVGIDPQMDDRFSIKKLASYTIFQRLRLFFLLKT